MRLTSVMPYMIILLELLLHWSKLILPHNHLMWILLHLIPQKTMLFSMTFLNGMRIVRNLVVLLLLHTQVYFFVGLTHFTSLGLWVFASGVTDHITSNKSLFSSLSSTGYIPLVPCLMDLRSYPIVLVLLIFFLIYPLITFFMFLSHNLTYYL